MDTSKEYINMCRKAVQVQEYFKNHDSDRCSFLHCTEHDRMMFHISSITDGYHDYTCSYGTEESHRLQYDYNHECVWLPRQDQLQEMVKINNAEFPVDVVRKLNSFCENYVYPSGLMSMEQLWLAFVMKTKFKKTWNGEGWI